MLFIEISSFIIALSMLDIF